MSKKINYKHFIQTLKAYDVYVTFRVLMHKQIEHHGGNPHDKFALQLRQAYTLQHYRENNWTTKRIISFLNAVKRAMDKEKYKYFTINNAL